MPSVPVPADPGWDDDLAWLDRRPGGRCYDTEPTRYPI